LQTYKKYEYENKSNKKMREKEAIRVLTREEVMRIHGGAVYVIVIDDDGKITIVYKGNSE
jgi:hypothetical protein